MDLGAKGRAAGVGLISLRLPEHAHALCLQGSDPDGKSIILALTAGVIVPRHQGSTGRLIQQA
jgi:hypothetical protein